MLSEASVPPCTLQTRLVLALINIMAKEVSKAGGG